MTRFAGCSMKSWAIGAAPQHRVFPMRIAVGNGGFARSFYEGLGSAEAMRFPANLFELGPAGGARVWHAPSRRRCWRWPATARNLCRSGRPVLQRTADRPRWSVNKKRFRATGRAGNSGPPSRRPLRAASSSRPRGTRFARRSLPGPWICRRKRSSRCSKTANCVFTICKPLTIWIDFRGRLAPTTRRNRVDAGAHWSRPARARQSQAFWPRR